MMLLTAAVATAAQGQEGQPIVRYIFARSTDELLKDQSGHGYDGADLFAHGDGAWAETEVGAAVRFSGNDDRVEVPYAAFPGGAGRVMLRVCLDRLDASQTLFRVYSPTGDGLVLAIRDGRLRWDYYDRSAGRWLGARTSASSTLSPGRWHDLAASWEAGGELVLRVDGQVRARQALDIGEADFPADGTMIIGNEHAGGLPMQGMVAGFELWSQPLQGQAATSEEAAEPLRFKPDQEVTLANDRLGFVFSREHAVPVGSVRPARPGLPILADEYLPSELTLWRVVFAMNYGRGKSVTLDNRDAQATRRVELMKTDAGQRALLTWEGLMLPGDGGKVRVQVTVDLPDDSAMSQWRIEVEAPEGAWGVQEVHFPLVTFAPPAEDPAAVRLVLPYRWGLAVPDPFYTAMVDRGNEFRRRAVYPSNMHMQFFALCGEGGASTYFATQDPAGFVKDYTFVAEPKRRRMRLEAIHYPEYRDRSSYTMSYPCVLGVFEGDWYDAAQIYRKWALHQSWTAKGPLHSRQDVPNWVKQTDLVVKSSTQPGRPLESNVRGLRQLLDHFGGPVLSCWYHWNEFDGERSVIAPAHQPETVDNGRPVEALPDVESALRELSGAYATAYINSKVYEQRKVPDADSRLMSQAAIVDEHGKHPLYNETFLPQWLMCRASPLWQQRMVETSERAMGFGFKGIYFDSFGRGENWCYASDHGHPIAGGNVGLKGQHEEARQIREAIRRIDPDAILVSEASTEYFIDVIDTKLLHYDVLAHGVPLWMAVYHDYQAFYGRTYAHNRDLTHQSFRQRLGTLFIHGGQLGRFFAFGAGDNRGQIYPFSEGQEAHLAFLDQLVALRREHRDFLGFGAMLRPVRIEPEPEMLDTTTIHHQVPVPTILTSSWRAPDGRSGVVVVNTWDEPRTVELVFDAAEYDFTPGAQVWVTRWTAQGHEKLDPIKAGPVRLPVHLSPSEAVVLELEPAP